MLNWIGELITELLQFIVDAIILAVFTAWVVSLFILPFFVIYKLA